MGVRPPRWHLDLLVRPCVFAANNTRCPEEFFRRAYLDSSFTNQEHVVATLLNSFALACYVHPNPGPITMKVSNITSAQTHQDDLGQDQADLHFVSEASLAKGQIAGVRTYLRAKIS